VLCAYTHQKYVDTESGKYKLFISNKYSYTFDHRMLTGSIMDGETYSKYAAHI
jgi:hypothetical protein